MCSHKRTAALVMWTELHGCVPYSKTRRCQAQPALHTSTCGLSPDMIPITSFSSQSQLGDWKYIYSIGYHIKISVSWQKNCLRQKLMPAHPTLMPSHGFKDDAVLFEPSCHTAYCYLTVVVTAHSQFMHETLHSSSIVNRIIPLYAGPSTKEFSISLTYLPRLNR